MTTTEKLDKYRELTNSNKHYSETKKAELMGFGPKPQSTNYYKAYWRAWDRGEIHAGLDRVIRVHNSVPRNRARMNPWFTFDKICNSKNLNIKVKSPVRFNLDQQAAALGSALEEAQRSGRIPRHLETIDDCTDEQLHEIDFRVFMEHLRSS